MKKLFFEELSNFNPQRTRPRKGSGASGYFSGDNLLESKETFFSINENNKLWHSLVLVCLTVILLLYFTVKAFSLQVIQEDLYRDLARQNTLRDHMLQPERGVIYDRNGEFLVRNKPAFSIDLATNICSLGKEGMELCKSLVNKISGSVFVDKERVFNEMEAGKTNIILSTGLTKEDILPIEANLYSYPGVSIVTAPQRDYLHKDIFAHLIGYVGIGGELFPTIEGKMGIEDSYDDHLGGVFGSRTVQVDALGKPLKVLTERDPVPGRNVTLFVDLELQKKAYELLKERVDSKKADAGVVVAQDPVTGGILAMVSYPSFDPDKISSGISKQDWDLLNNDPTFPFFNRAVTAAYPPGSVFKMPVASAILMEGVVTEHTIVHDPGFIQIGSYIFRNWKLDGHGDVNVRRAIQVSNDVYFYAVGGGYGGLRGLGIEKLSDWAGKFGYGKKTGIDINGENAGFMPDGRHRDWYLGDTFISSIGQGDILATPLQVNNATVYFANGGYLPKPRIVKSIDGVGDTEMEIIARDLTDSRIYEIVRQGMKMSVEPGGTAYPLFDFPVRHGFEIAGKTGTSEYIDTQGRERTHAVFTVFAPYEGAEIALTVFLEGGGGGASDASPIAKELLDLWFGK
jgi:penicillin-binding protein 2